MYRIVRPCFKSLRGWLPVNYLATGLAKGICDLTSGAYPNLAIRHLPRCGNVRALLPNGSVLRLWSRGDDWVANQAYTGAAGQGMNQRL
jgi:hypothetical protein